MWRQVSCDDGMADNSRDVNYSTLSAAEHGKILRSQLPSIRAWRENGSMVLSRQKKSTRKRSGFLCSWSGSARVTPMPSAGHSSIVLDDIRLDRLKELTFSMAKKREIRKQLVELSGMDAKTGWKNESNQKWKKIKEVLADASWFCELWSSSMREIEGRFGNGVRSYFSFLRFLFLLNTAIFGIMFFFICVPTFVFENVESTSTSVSSINGSEHCEYKPYNATTVQHFSQYVIWWFTGQGFMEDTLLFYGYYKSAVNTIASIRFSYNIQLAYVLVAYCYFILSLILIVKRAATGVKESLVAGEDRFYAYCNKVFCGWDFGITDKGAAELKHTSVKYELESDLEEERMKKKQAERTTKEKVKLYSKRVLINLIILIVLVGCLYGVYAAAEFALLNQNSYGDNFSMNLFVTYLVPIVITTANFIAPLLFELLVGYEEYSPAVAIQLTLARTVVLRLVSLMFLYIVVYFQIHCEDYGFIDIRDSHNCSYCDGTPCWETYMGQEMYKLTVMDFFIVVGMTLFVEFPRRLIVDHSKFAFTKKLLQPQEFHIPSNVLSLVNTQSVVWIGTFYAPMLPVVVIIKFFVFFYVKKLTLLYNCKPASRPYRASRSGTFFFIILMFGFLVAAIPVGVSISLIEPSRYCGPFRGLETISSSVANAINSTFPKWMASIIWFVGSGTFGLVVAAVLCLVLYYYIALSSAHKKMISVLKDQLTMEGKDKQFLLQRVNELQLGISAGKMEEAIENRIRRAGSAGSTSEGKNTVAFEDDNGQSQRKASE